LRREGAQTLDPGRNAAPGTGVANAAVTNAARMSRGAYERGDVMNETMSAEA
jgi:hypothetical protein